jgi:ADP-heptose:LPS heptosyltransferase
VRAAPALEIGILNLTRFGDLVQTSPVTAGLRKRHPSARIHLMVKSRFREVADLLPGVDCVHEIDGDALARTLCDPEIGFLDAYRAVRDTVERLRDVGCDVLYNFTHSRASSVLLSLLRARSSVGFALDRNGQRTVRNPWLVHIGTLVRARRLVHLNLVDAYAGAAGLHGSCEPLAVHVSGCARAFAAEQIAGEGPWLAVQLGASQDAKTWAVERYAAVLRDLRARLPRLRVAVVGVAAEQARAERLAQLAPEVPLHSLVGRTRIAELAAVLERCAVLLTGDTGTMHLAAAVGTRTCAVFVGLGTPHETAAYGEGHFALLSRLECAPCSHLVRCGRPVCHEDFPAPWLAQLLAALLAGGNPAQLPRLARADAFRTRFGDDGLLEVVPLHRREPAAEDLLALAYREAFRASFADEIADWRRPLRRAREYYGVDPGEWPAQLPPDLCTHLAELGELGERGRSLAASLADCARDAPQLRARAAALRAVDEAVIRLGRADPLVAPLALALEGEAEALPEQGLAAVAAASARNYASLASRARFVQSLACARERKISEGELE